MLFIFLSCFCLFLILASNFLKIILIINVKIKHNQEKQTNNIGNLKRKKKILNENDN